MNRTKEFKNVKSIVELDPSKVYLIEARKDKMDLQLAIRLSNKLLEAGVFAFIIPEDCIKNYQEFSTKEARKAMERVIEKGQEQEIIMDRMAKDIAHTVELDEETINKICLRLYSLGYRKA